MINIDNISNNKFYKYLTIKLNKNHLDKSDLIGLTSVIIYSKDLFLYNKDIKPFIALIFNQSFSDYVMKSRTLIVAKSTRIMNSMTKEELDNVQIKIMEYLNIKPMTNDKTNKNSKKSYDKLNTWMNNL